MTDNTNQVNHLTVALLLSDMEDIKEITHVFRKLGVIPHFYEDLKSFWQGTLERMPSLAIVDVKKMNEMGLILKNHPNVMSEELPLLFFYSEKTEPLLVSTHEIFHLGTFKKSNSYEGTFKGLLKRINKIILLEQENHNLKFSVKAKTDEIKILENEKANLIKIDHFQGLSKEVCLLFQEQGEEVDFFKALEKVFHLVEEVDSFSFVELSFNGQKLISPLSHSRKYRAVPSIWLGQICKVGIELFAQNMASQVAHEVLGEKVISLFVNGKNGLPEKMIFIKVTSDLCFEHFDWNLLEVFLNGYYSSLKLKQIKDEQQVSREFHSAYEAMSFLDQFVFGATIIDHVSSGKMEYVLIDVNHTCIVDLLQKDGTQRFFWKKFRDDFLGRLELQSKCLFRSFEYGVTHFGFLVKSQDLDYFFNEVKEFTSKFSYWKYFENNETVLYQEMRPIVKMSPLSSFAYLQLVEKKSVQGVATSKKNEILWNRVSEHEI